MTIKVGDRVRVSGRSDWANGLEGEVTAVEEGDDLLLLHFEDARLRGHGAGAAYWYVNKEEVSLVEPRLQVNDFVVVTADFPSWATGRIGIIEKIDDHSFTNYLIRIPGETKEGHGGDGMGYGGHGKWWMSEGSFVRLTPEALPAPVFGPTKKEIEQKQRREIISEIVAKLQAAYPEGDLEDEEAIEDILTRAGENFGVYLA